MLRTSSMLYQSLKQWRKNQTLLESNSQIKALHWNLTCLTANKGYPHMAAIMITYYMIKLLVLSLVKQHHSDWDTVVSPFVLQTVSALCVMGSTRCWEVSFEILVLTSSHHFIPADLSAAHTHCQCFLFYWIQIQSLERLLKFTELSRVHEGCFSQLGFLTCSISMEVAGSNH